MTAWRSEAWKPVSLYRLISGLEFGGAGSSEPTRSVAQVIESRRPTAAGGTDPDGQLR
jgi:hypothetical protein